MDWLTSELIAEINNTSWVDGIGTIVVCLVAYAVFRWIKKNI